MKKFEFSKSDKASVGLPEIFSGSMFYNAYKEAEFLRHSDNIETILSKGYELRKMMKDAEPGEVVKIKGVWLKKNTPLLVKKAGENVTVENYEFTANRLCGLVAAYAFDNRHRFAVIKSSEALSLGLVWNNGDKTICRLFLSAVSGTEHFYDQFRYWPLICALRKLEMKKITLQPVVKMARIKNNDGVRMGRELMMNFIQATKLWSYFPGGCKQDLNESIRKLPAELKKVLLATD